MPPKKSKKSKKKKTTEYLPPIYNIPEYEDPEIVKPRVDLIIKIANPVNDLLTLKLTVPIHRRIEYVIKQVAKMHQGAIAGITICRDRYSPEEVLDPNKTLEECGILEGEVKMYYDYSPVCGALLK